MENIVSSCGKCGGTGFRLSVALDRQYKHAIPFAVLLTEAEPCDCLAGPWFAARQLEFIGLSLPLGVRQGESGAFRRIDGMGKRIPLRQIA